MTGIAAVGVNDDFPTRESGITLRTADDEFACGVHQIAALGAIWFEREICSGRHHNVSPEVFTNAVAHFLFIGQTSHLCGVLG